MPAKKSSTGSSNKSRIKTASNSKQLLIAPDSPIAARVRAASLEIQPDTKVWKSNVRQASSWHKQNLPRPATKRGLGKLDESMRPLGGLIVYPVTDPYTALQRATFRLLMEENPWILRANTIIQKLVITTSTTDIEPRADRELQEEELTKWQEEEIQVPFFMGEDDGRDGMRTPSEIKTWIDRLAIKLDAQSVWFNGYAIMREQGRCAIGMFPETRDEDQYYQIPKALRITPPEFTRRPILDFDSGELQAVEITGLTTGGGNLDGNRCVYLMNSNNLQLFSDFYGRSAIRPLMDVGKVLLTIYGSDFTHAAEFTWHQPKVFRHTLPARDVAKGIAHIEDVLDKFNQNLNGNQGKDMSVTQAVELLSSSTNSGDIDGLVKIQNECIEAIAAFYNIPPFMLAKGKAGRLGGNANREEIDSFLKVEIRPEQEIMENVIESQFYDRILAILFMVEPDEVDNATKVPVRMRINFEKPDIAAAIDLEQYEILKDMNMNSLITTEDMMEKLGVRDLLKINTATGTDPSPTIKTWVKRNPHWASKPLLLKKGMKPRRSRDKKTESWAVIDSTRTSIAKKNKHKIDWENQ